MHLEIRQDCWPIANLAESSDELSFLGEERLPGVFGESADSVDQVPRCHRARTSSGAIKQSNPRVRVRHILLSANVMTNKGGPIGRVVNDVGREEPYVVQRHERIE